MAKDIDIVIKAKGRLAMVEGALMTEELSGEKVPQKIFSAVRVIEGYLEELLKGNEADARKERVAYDRREAF